MSEFPKLKTGAVLQHPAEWGHEPQTYVVRFVDGTEQRFRERGSPLRKWIIRLDLLDEEEARRVEQFFEAQQGRCGSFAFTDPWDGQQYPDCSFEQDVLEIRFADHMRAETALVVRQNRG